MAGLEVTGGLELVAKMPSLRLESRRFEGLGWRRARQRAEPAVVEAALGIAAAPTQGFCVPKWQSNHCHDFCGNQPLRVPFWANWSNTNLSVVWMKGTRTL